MALASGGTSSIFPLGDGFGIGAGGTKPCVDTATDPDNCGTCGKKCGSVRLVGGYLNPTSYALDATNLYWANAGFTENSTLRKVPRAGGRPVTLASDREMANIALTATSIYWTDPPSGKVMRVPIDGGTPDTVASNEPRPNKIAVDVNSVYWSTISTPDCPDGGLTCASGGMLKKAALDGSSPQTLASHIEVVGSIVVDGMNVYWTAPEPNLPLKGTIFKMPIAGGIPQVVISNVPGLRDAIAITATNVYWIQTRLADGGGDWTLFTMPIGGGAVTALVPTDARSLYAAGSNLYLFDPGILKIPLNGGAPALPGGQPVPRPDYLSPAVSGGIGDAANVYWWSSFDGAIYTLDAPTCSAGQCACPAEQSLCLDTCVDLNTDQANCGTCGNNCAAGVSCKKGHCGA